MTVAHLLVLVLLLAAGCVSATPPSTVRRRNIGPPPTRHEEIPKAIGARLRDPYTAVYTFERPVRAWFFSDDQIRWAVCGTVNAKNAYGGYVGVKPFVVFYRHGKIESVSYDNSIDTGLCTKWHAAGYYE